jgi:restriction endonuclease Mrr
MLPNSSELNKALLEVLGEHPSGLLAKEIDKLVAIKLHLSADDLNRIRSGSRTEFAYRMAWERTHAKAKGLIEKGEKGIWSISNQD